MRFLLIEDNVADVELIQHILRKRWPDCVVDTMPDATKLHKIQTPQIYKAIISDYNFIVGTAMDVFDFIIDNRINVPCIIVSGFLQKDQVATIEFLNFGGMVLKDNLKELPEKIESAIRNFSTMGINQMNSKEMKFLLKRAEIDIRRRIDQFS